MVGVATSNTRCRPSGPFFSRPRKSHCDLASDLAVEILEAREKSNILILLIILQVQGVSSF